MLVLSATDFQVNNDAVGQTAPCVTGIWERCRLRRDLHAKQVSGKGVLGTLFHVWNREAWGKTFPRQYLRYCDRACSDRHALRRTQHPREQTLALPAREENRRGSDLFPCSDPDGYQAEPGPYSCRSRHYLRRSCRTVRTLRVLLRLSPRTQPPPLPSAAYPPPLIPLLHLPVHHHITTWRGSVGCAD